MNVSHCMSVLSVARVQFPAAMEVFQGTFLADHTLPTRPEPAWQKMVQSPHNDTTQLVDIKEEGPSQLRKEHTCMAG